MRFAMIFAMSCALGACGRSRVVSPIPVADAGPDARLADGGPDGGPDGGADGGRDAAVSARAATLTESCGPADGFAWQGVIADPAWACGEDRSEAQHFTLYLHTAGEREGIYRWSGGGGFGDQVGYCPGGLAPCETSSEGEAQVSLVGGSPSIRLRAVFSSFTINETFPARLCPASGPCG